MNGERDVLITMIGNAYKLQLRLVDSVGDSCPHGKPVVILDNAAALVLGEAVRDLLRTRVRTPRKAKAGEAVSA